LRKALISLTTDLCFVNDEKAIEKALKKVKEHHSDATFDDASIIISFYHMIIIVLFMENERYVALKRRNETSKYVKLMCNVIIILIFMWNALVCSSGEASESSEDQKSNGAERSDVLDRLLMSFGLEKEKHKANFATFMNVIVSQRWHNSLM